MLANPKIFFAIYQTLVNPHGLFPETEWPVLKIWTKVCLLIFTDRSIRFQLNNIQRRELNNYQWRSFGLDSSWLMHWRLTSRKYQICLKIIFSDMEQNIEINFFTSNAASCVSFEKYPRYNLCNVIIFKSGQFPASFIYFRLFNTVHNKQVKKQMFNKFCRWQELNCGPLVSKATALPTEPQ